jgi:hypothetical protein
MTRVALIVTGELERRGLATSLSRLFPNSEFHIEMKVDGFTSPRVRNMGATAIPGLVDKMAAALVAAVDPGRNGTPSDLAVAVDDLEIANLDQPDIVVETFRDAVARHVEQAWQSDRRRAQARIRLRECASFHLLSPMTEAYFFGDRDVLTVLGIAERAELAAGVDIEEFTVVDSRYLATPRGPESWAKDNRARHPKHYLQYLTDGGYRETREGVAALGATRWEGLLANHPTHLRLLRSFLRDLAAGLGDETRVGPGPEHPATSLKWDVLRNA